MNDVIERRRYRIRRHAVIGGRYFTSVIVLSWPAAKPAACAAVEHSGSSRSLVFQTLGICTEFQTQKKI